VVKSDERVVITAYCPGSPNRSEAIRPGERGAGKEKANLDDEDEDHVTKEPLLPVWRSLDAQGLGRRGEKKKERNGWDNRSGRSPDEE